MDKFKAWMNEPKNMPFVIGGAVLIVGAVVFFIFMSGRSKQQAIPPGMQGYGYGPPGMPGMGMPGMKGMKGGPAGMKGGPMGMKGMPGMKGGPMGMPGMGMKGMGGGYGGPMGMPGMGMKGMGGGYGGYGAYAGGGDATVVASAPVAKPVPLLPYRKNPFEPLGGPPSKNAQIAPVLNSLPRVNLPNIKWVTPFPVPRQEEIESLPPQPFRRMSGVLMNDKVSAILETNGESDIVVPGMIVTRGGSKVMVEAINSEEITLKTLDTKRPMYIKVNLAGSVAVPAGGAPARGAGASGVMGGPGMMPGMGGPGMMPGMMPGMGGPMGGGFDGGAPPIMLY